MEQKPDLASLAPPPIVPPHIAPVNLTPANLVLPNRLPGWLPDAMRLYLDHTGEGVSLREIARREGKAASTIMRQVRRCEARRDDPLVDEALSEMSGEGAHSGATTAEEPSPRHSQQKDRAAMTAPIRPSALALDEDMLAREARRILRRLAEPGAVMALAQDLEKAAVLRNGPGGDTVKTAVVDRVVAQAFALKDWISCRKPGRVAIYELTAAGRAALKRLIETEDRRRMAHMADGMAEAPVGFAGPKGAAQPVANPWDKSDADEDGQRRRIRYNAAESPVSVLARRRDRDGKPFLRAEQVRAAERLREDFELAQMGPRGAQNWERFLTSGGRGGYQADIGPDSGLAEGPRAARDRVALALADLGPDLGDVALRVCCFLEGLEQAEQRMGWAARSGKVVLRIALERLQRHYEATYGKGGPMIW